MELEKKALLENFVVDNGQLEDLESLLSRFNIFEAIGMVRQEIRHSNFLAFLLNPSASHRLGDIVLKTFLKRLLMDANNASISLIDVDVADLTDTQVRREWENIDILLYSPKNRIVCAIENKVDSGEHSNQLQRYRDVVLGEFKDFRQIFVYLTPVGISAYEDEDQRHWLPYSYDKFSNLIDDLCNRYRSTIGSEVYTLMQHYSSLIKRHLMEDSEIAQLCQKIYRQHKEALDLIYEHRPNLDSDIFELLKNTVKNTPSSVVVLNHAWASRKILGFAIPGWDALPFQKTCQEWTPTKRILMFEFKVEPPNINLVLMLGPGELSNRLTIFKALESQDIMGFTGQKPQHEKDWRSLIHRTVSKNVSPEASISDISEEIYSFWSQFLEIELLRVNKAINQGLSLTNPSGM